MDNILLNDKKAWDDELRKRFVKVYKSEVKPKAFSERLRKYFTDSDKTKLINELTDPSKYTKDVNDNISVFKNALDKSIESKPITRVIDNEVTSNSPIINKIGKLVGKTQNEIRIHPEKYKENIVRTSDNEVENDRRSKLMKDHIDRVYNYRKLNHGNSNIIKLSDKAQISKSHWTDHIVNNYNKDYRNKNGIRINVSTDPSKGAGSYYLVGNGNIEINRNAIYPDGVVSHEVAHSINNTDRNRYNDNKSNPRDYALSSSPELTRFVSQVQEDRISRGLDPIYDPKKLADYLLNYNKDLFNNKIKSHTNSSGIYSESSSNLINHIRDNMKESDLKQIVNISRSNKNRMIAFSERLRKCFSELRHPTKSETSDFLNNLGNNVNSNNMVCKCIDAFIDKYSDGEVKVTIDKDTISKFKKASHD